MRVRGVIGAVLVGWVAVAVAVAWRTGGAPERDWQADVAAWRHPDPLPDLPLVDQDGRAFGLHELAGQHVLVGFIFTRCNVVDACPMTMQRLAAVQAAWGPDDPPLRLLVLTLDPAYDTPAVLKAYAERFGLRTGPGEAVLATGPEPLLAGALPSLFNILTLPGRDGLEHTVKISLLRPDLTLAESWKDGAFHPAALREALRD